MSEQIMLKRKDYPGRDQSKCSRTPPPPSQRRNEKEGTLAYV